MPAVLVTGAGRGLGPAITEHMSARGWDVYATARSEGALRSLCPYPYRARDEPRRFSSLISEGGP
jgi:NAD(P)-dependent dehydrogenase (short-subunit alcohol dehydrogenase family)